MAEIEFTVDNQQKSQTAAIRDLSVRGIGIICAQKLEPGTKFVIHLRGTTWNCATTLPAVIRHATELADGTWLLGVSFSRVVTADDFLALNSRRNAVIASKP